MKKGPGSTEMRREGVLGWRAELGAQAELCRERLTTAL